MTTLSQLSTQYKQTDKFSLGYIDEFYEKLFTPIKYSVENILEIGVKSGQSLLLWNDFFTTAQIFGVDVVVCTDQRVAEEPRIKFFKQDAYSSEFLNLFPDNFFDIIIDDGPHTLSSMKYSLKEYLGKLKQNGILVIEDIYHTSSTYQLVSMIDQSIYSVEVIDMSNKQKTNFLKERWKDGLDVIIVTKL